MAAASRRFGAPSLRRMCETDRELAALTRRVHLAGVALTRRTPRGG
jgi:hypothetical protein